jgi:Fe-S-cluster containining protein
MLPAEDETVVVEFSLAVGEGQMRMSAQVPAGETNLTQLLPVLQSLDSALIGEVGEQLQQGGRTVSCRAGCGACCRQMVPISIFEAESLGACIQTLPEDRQRELAARFDQGLRKLAAGGLIDRMVTGDWLAETDSARQLALDYLYQRVACPFLEEESCSIHPMRPLVCREYLVTSDPVHCEDPATLKSEPVMLPFHFSRALNRIGARVENSSRGWIPLLFLLAWMKSGAQPGDAVTDIGPKVLYLFIQQVTTTDDATTTFA